MFLEKQQLTAGDAEGAGLLVEGEEGEVHGAGAYQGDPGGDHQLRVIYRDFSPAKIGFLGILGQL